MKEAGQLALSYDGAFLIPEFAYCHVRPSHGLQSSLREL